MTHRALVLFSGGQDSTVCLAWALQNFEHVETVGFDYAQRHRVELDCRKIILQKLRTAFPHWAAKLHDDHLVDITSLGAISETSLTRETAMTFEENGLPNSFVPGRNLVFFTYAAAVAYRRGIDDLIGGMCETDYSGYPDCRADTLNALQQALNLGMDKNFRLHTPLMHIDKAATWKMAMDLGGAALVDIVRDDTHSCYMGDHTHKHEWGYGCGTCPACLLRAKGYNNFNIYSA